MSPRIQLPVPHCAWCRARRKRSNTRSLETKFSNRVVNDCVNLDFCRGIGWLRQRVQGRNRIVLC